LTGSRPVYPIVRLTTCPAENQGQKNPSTLRLSRHELLPTQRNKALIFVFNGRPSRITAGDKLMQPKRKDRKPGLGMFTVATRIEMPLNRRFSFLNRAACQSRQIACRSTFATHRTRYSADKSLRSFFSRQTKRTFEPGRQGV
jgi:hypothetical protein